MTAVRIERLAAGGDGVGHLDDGVVVFVPRTAPGDDVEIEVTERRARYARARLRQVVHPGPDRVGPLCPHYEGDRCGGCQLQHVSHEAQLSTKRGVVGDALRRIAHRPIGDPDIVPSPSAWRYRTKVALAVRGGAIGFHRYDAPGSVFELEDCHIARIELMKLWQLLRSRRQWLPEATSELVLRQDRTGRLHVIVVGGAPPWDASLLQLPEEISVWWQPTEGAARVVVGPQTGFPALAFEQVNPELAERIRGDAVDQVGATPGAVVWDLYGGVGDTAVLLAERGASVLSLDADRQAVAWARQRFAASATTAGIQSIAGLAEESLHRLPEPATVVVNPPREGLHQRVATWLDTWGAKRGGRRLIYVSCDPATLARDLTRLTRFEVVRVVAYDLFPQTSHVETLAVLEAA